MDCCGCYEHSPLAFEAPTRRCASFQRSRDTQAAFDWFGWLGAPSAVHRKVCETKETQMFVASGACGERVSKVIAREGLCLTPFFFFYLRIKKRTTSERRSREEGKGVPLLLWPLYGVAALPLSPRRRVCVAATAEEIGPVSGFLWPVRNFRHSLSYRWTSRSPRCTCFHSRGSLCDRLDR